MNDGLLYRNARAADVPAIRKILQGIPTIDQTDEFYESLEAAIETQKFPGLQGRFACVVAQIRKPPKIVIGAIVLQTYNIIEARESGMIPFDFMEPVDLRDEILIVRAVGVLPECRREGVGTELIQTGVRVLASNSDVRAIMILSPTEDPNCEGFFESLYFDRYGQLPRAYERVDDTFSAATVWLQLLTGEPIDYVNPHPSVPLNLADPQLPARKRKKMPKWVRDLLLHFVLPFGALGLLFVLSYFLVSAGPLKGISRDDWVEKTFGSKRHEDL